MLREKTLAVLGAGMMGGALTRGLVASGAMPASGIRLFDTNEPAAVAVAAQLGHGARAMSSAQAAVTDADLILVAVKPQIVSLALAEIAPLMSPAHLVISIAAGVRLTTLEELLPAGIPVIRSMPNTPALVGKGATALSRGAQATAEHLALAQSLFAGVGLSVEVPERLLDAVTGLSGSGPAYVYLIIEALTDGGVKEGLPRDTARLLAVQTVLGAAQMVTDSGLHPAQLKDNVTTPGGTTIAGLHVLERAGLRAALMDAVQTAAERARELSQLS